jgi:hypothetical protein
MTRLGVRSSIEGRFGVAGWSTSTWRSTTESSTIDEGGDQAPVNSVRSASTSTVVSLVDVSDAP